MATLAELQEDLAAARASRLRILRSQEYSVGDGVIHRRNRGPELEQVNALIKDLDAQITALGGGASGPRRVYHVRASR